MLDILLIEARDGAKAKGIGINRKTRAYLIGSGVVIFNPVKETKTPLEQRRDKEWSRVEKDLFYMDRSVCRRIAELRTEQNAAQRARWDLETAAAGVHLQPGRLPIEGRGLLFRLDRLLKVIKEAKRAYGPLEFSFGTSGVTITAAGKPGFRILWRSGIC